MQAFSNSNTTSQSLSDLFAEAVYQQVSRLETPEEKKETFILRFLAFGVVRETWATHKYSSIKLGCNQPR